jgi:hypothetical protein
MGSFGLRLKIELWVIVAIPSPPSTSITSLALQRSWLQKAVALALPRSSLWRVPGARVDARSHSAQTARRDWSWACSSSPAAFIGGIITAWLTRQ